MLKDSGTDALLRPLANAQRPSKSIHFEAASFPIIHNPFISAPGHYVEFGSERNFEFRVTPPRSVTLSFASVGHSPRSDTLSVASNGVALKTNFEFLVQGFTKAWLLDSSLLIDL